MPAEGSLKNHLALALGAQAEDYGDWEKRHPGSWWTRVVGFIRFGKTPKIHYEEHFLLVSTRPVSLMELVECGREYYEAQGYGADATKSDSHHWIDTSGLPGLYLYEGSRKAMYVDFSTLGFMGFEAPRQRILVTVWKLPDFAMSAAASRPSASQGAA